MSYFDDPLTEGSRVTIGLLVALVPGAYPCSRHGCAAHARYEVETEGVPDLGADYGTGAILFSAWACAEHLNELINEALAELDARPDLRIE